VLCVWPRHGFDVADTTGFFDGSVLPLPRGFREQAVLIEEFSGVSSEFEELVREVP
jgi:hypothetical protein